MKKKVLISLTTPGEVLLEEFIKPLELTQKEVADAIGIPVSRLSEIIHGKRGVTTDTAIRLGKFFKVTAKFWLNLQDNYEIEKLGDEKRKEFALIRAYRKPRGVVKRKRVTA